MTIKGISKAKHDNSGKRTGYRKQDVPGLSHLPPTEAISCYLEDSLATLLQLSGRSFSLVTRPQALGPARLLYTLYQEANRKREKMPVACIFAE